MAPRYTHNPEDAEGWFRRFPDLARTPLFTMRLKLSCGNATIKAYEGPVQQPYGHTTLFCELRAPGVVFPRNDFYVGVPSGTSIDGDAAKENVLALFALRPGDTDEEFFQDYTPEQLDFVEQCGEEIYMINEDRYGHEYPPVVFLSNARRKTFYRVRGTADYFKDRDRLFSHGQYTLTRDVPEEIEARAVAEQFIRDNPPKGRDARCWIERVHPDGGFTVVSSWSAPDGRNWERDVRYSKNSR